MHKISVKPHQIGLLTLIAIGTILRLWDITEYSYWIDELYSAARAIPEKTLLMFIIGVPNRIHLPIIYCCGQHITCLDTMKLLEN